MSGLIIDDNTDFDVHTPDSHKVLCGTLPRRIAYGDVPGAQPSQQPTIPMEQWPDRIADLERNKSTLKDIWKDSKIGVLQQSPLLYCHAFSLAMVAMIERELAGLPYVELSASSVGAIVTGFQNKGWYIELDLQQAVDTGICSTGFVPMRTTNGADFRAGWKADAAKHRVTIFDELKPRNLLQHGSALLSLKPCGVAVNWWGHAICDLVLKDLNPGLAATDESRYGIEFLNSWGESWNGGGFSVRAGSKKYADAIYCVSQLANSDT